MYLQRSNAIVTFIHFCLSLIFENSLIQVKYNGKNKSIISLFNVHHDILTLDET